jgi:hypothetical protein
MQNYSRRQVAVSLFSLFGCRCHLNAQSAAGEPARSSMSGSAPWADDPHRAKACKYQADAAILFLGMTVYRRSAVGDGEAAVEESGEGASLRRTLFFAAGSDPKRARGLSRLGWMRETVWGPEASPSQIGYSGVLSSSPEESLEHARQSVTTAPESGRVSFGAVMGSNSAGRSRSATARFEFDAGAVWSDRALINQAHSLFDGNVNWRETSWPNLPTQAPPTFLYQLVTLLRKRTHSAAGRYVYSEQEYALTLERREPSGDREGLVTVRGKVRNLRTGRETAFRLWLDDDSSVVPVRFEFQPRSFLRLTFRAVKI